MRRAEYGFQLRVSLVEALASDGRRASRHTEPAAPLRMFAIVHADAPATLTGGRFDATGTPRAVASARSESP